MGLKPGFTRFLSMFQRRKKKEHIAAFYVQEHMLPESKDADWVQQAKIAGFTLLISYGKADDEESKKGGVLILLDDSTLELESVLHLQPGFIHLKVTGASKTLLIACVYAPAKDLPRLDFLNDIKTKITKDTIAGGDWNCVPDKTIDVDSTCPLTYPNIGGALMNTITSDVGLIDERREQLGTEAEYTRSHDSVDRAGHITSTRIDIWFTPSNLDFLQSFEVDNSFIFKLKKSDHSAVSLTLDNQRGEMGHERKTINEELILRADIQTSIKKNLKKSTKGTRYNATNGNAP